MSSRRRVRLVGILVGLSLTTLPGCWEQWSETWWPQMKWQKTVQAYERVEFSGRVEGFTPPEGTVPVSGYEPSYERYDPAADTLVNPTNPQDFNSLNRGREVYQNNCIACHGERGMGNGPVSQAGPKTGPFAGVFPVVTAIARSDGYIYNFIRNGGGRMPNYRRIPSEDRWHLVNYVRHLQRGGQP